MNERGQKETDSISFKYKTLSIVIPVYNEAGTIDKIIANVLDSPVSIEKEIVIVDDCSTDGTRERLEGLKHKYNDANIKIYYNEKNRGKGFSVRTGFKHASGDIVLIQDADLEYDPNDYPKLLAPILEDKAEVVYGSRFLGESHRVLYFWHYVGNKLITTFSNMLNNINLSDMETCYKVFLKEVIDSIELRSNRFGIEPEITAKVCKKKYRIYEVAISYNGRKYEEGKKITWKDGIAALWFIVWYRFFD